MAKSTSKTSVRIIFVLGVLALVFGGASLLLALLYSLPLLMSDPLTFLTAQLIPSFIFLAVGAYLIQKSKNKTE